MHLLDEPTNETETSITELQSNRLTADSRSSSFSKRVNDFSESRIKHDSADDKDYKKVSRVIAAMTSSAACRA